MDVVDVIDRLINVIITNSDSGTKMNIKSVQIVFPLGFFRFAKLAKLAAKAGPRSGSLLKEIVQNQYSASNHPHPTHPPLFDMCSFAFQNYRFTASAVR
jgi:hypothetical protein